MHLNSLVWKWLINIIAIGVGHDSVAMRVVMVTSPCTPSPLLWLVQLLLWLHNHGPQLTEAAPPCPTLCTCSNQASRVICTRKSLDQVPDSISENTRYLNLQENTIQVNMASSTNSDWINIFWQQSFWCCYNMLPCFCFHTRWSSLTHLSTCGIWKSSSSPRTTSGKLRWELLLAFPTSTHWSFLTTVSQWCRHKPLSTSAS